MIHTKYVIQHSLCVLKRVTLFLFDPWNRFQPQYLRKRIQGRGSKLKMYCLSAAVCQSGIHCAIMEGICPCRLDNDYSPNSDVNTVSTVLVLRISANCNTNTAVSAVHLAATSVTDPSVTWSDTGCTQSHTPRTVYSIPSFTFKKALRDCICDLL